MRRLSYSGLVRAYPYEHRSEPVVPRAVFLRRLVTSSALGFVGVAASMAIGMFGFRTIEGLSWIDAFLNSAMLLGGMGPIDHERTDAGVVLAPVVHRFLHRLHQQEQGR